MERDGDRVRLITRGGYEWSKRYPWIVEVALRNRHKQYVIDGKAVILGVDGVSDFNAFHSRKQDHEVQLCAFDVVALDSDDLRKLPLSMRKANWNGCYMADPTARSVQIYSAPPAAWDLRGWFQSTGTDRIKPADRSIGSRSRTAAILQWSANCDGCPASNFRIADGT